MSGEMVPVDAVELADLRAMASRVEQVENEPMPEASSPTGMAAAVVAARSAAALWIRTGHQ